MLVRFAVGLCLLAVLRSQPARPSFHVELFEDLPDEWVQKWSFEGLVPALTWDTGALGVLAVPGKLSPAGMVMHRDSPFALRITGTHQLPSGDYEFRLRSRLHARLYVDNELVLIAAPPQPRQLSAAEIAAKEAEEKKAREEAAEKAAAQQAREELLRRRLEEAALENNEEVQRAVRAEVEKAARGSEKSDTKPPAEIEQAAKRVHLASGNHRFRLELTGDDLDREVTVVYRQGSGSWRAIGAAKFSEKGWAEWAEADKETARRLISEASAPLRAQWEEAWKARHAAMRERASLRQDHGRSIDKLIEDRLAKAGVQAAPVCGEYEFVRRVYLDVLGVIPTAEQVRDFIQDPRPDRRDQLIDRLLAAPDWAVPWVAYWEDVLAENPKLYGPVPNSTGSFKEWIYRTFAEDRGYDRFAAELVLMEGTPEQEGTLGFRESVGNDSPMAEKAHVIAQAFMGANMKCARCHDSPVNRYRQRDLFGLAALLNGAPVMIPSTSSVGEVPGRRRPAVSVTSKPGDLITASFVFDPVRNVEQVQGRGRAWRAALAEWLISHKRFAQVGVNRIWKQLMGTGLVEPVDDWGSSPKIAHPELLDYLTDEFLSSAYSVKHLERLILKSRAYQRKREHALAEKRDANNMPWFAAQPVRRMRAEELIDSLHRAVRREFRTERIAYQAVDYGYPKRTWQIVTLSNEEDNAVLVKPLLQEIITAAKTFGWRDQRPDPISVRDAEPNPLQPLMMANGELVDRLVKLSDYSYYTQLSSRDLPLQEFIETLVLNVYSRPPSEFEKNWIRSRLQSVWRDRRIPEARQARRQEKRLAEITIGDTVAAHEYILKVREGEPPTPALTEAYRKQFEEVLWVMLNSPEFVFVP